MQSMDPVADLEARLEAETFRFTKANAAELGKKGGEASGRSRRHQPSIEDLRKQGGSVLKNLLDAAAGKGEWSELEAKDRLSALKAALPYILGRPVPMRTGGDEPEEEESGDFSITEAAASDQSPNVSADTVLRPDAAL